MSGCRLSEFEGSASSMFMTSDIFFSKMIGSPILYYSFKNNESASAFEKKAGHLQPSFDLVLLADDDIQLRVFLTTAKKGFVVSECWADERDVIELATERSK